MEVDAASSKLWVKMVATPLDQCDDKLRGSAVVTISRTDSVSSAFRTLCDNDILSAPVVDNMDRFEGMISMKDLVDFTLEQFDRPFRPERYSPDYLNKKARFRNARVSELLKRKRLNTPKIDSVGPVDEDFSLFSTFEMLARSGQHRLAVINWRKAVTGVITHSILIKWLWENRECMSQELLNTSISQIRPYNFVTSIQASRRALEAFKIMQQQNISAIAVVDEKGSLVDVISERDLRGVQPESMTFRFLWNRIDFYKSKIKLNYPNAPLDPVHVPQSATLKDVLSKMVSKNVHRVFVTSEIHMAHGGLRPLDVISQGDILNFFLEKLQLGSVE